VSTARKGPIFLPYDIESTGLKADFGTILSFGSQRWTIEDGEYVPIDPKPVVFSIADTKPFKKGDPTDDSELCAKARERLLSANYWIGYYSKGFDLPFLQAKMGEHKLGYLPAMGRAHVDLFFVAKSAFALSRKSLGNVSYHLGVDGSKTPVEGRIWKKAAAGHKPSIQYIVAHNAADVTLTWNLYREMLPLIVGHAFVGKKGDCNRCGSAVIRRGEARTSTIAQHYRYSCLGPVTHWTTRGPLKEENY